jgi:hypothetical protein
MTDSLALLRSIRPGLRVLFFLCSLVAVMRPHFVLAQGALDPPPGTPAPTMKRLDEVEPRVNLQATPHHRA